MPKTLIRITESDLSRMVESVLLEMGSYDDFFDDLDNVTDQWGNTPEDYEGDDEIDWDYVKGAVDDLKYVFEGILQYGEDAIQPWEDVNRYASTLIEELNGIQEMFEHMGVNNQTFTSKIIPTAQKVYKFVQDEYSITEINESALMEVLRALDVIDNFVGQF